MSSPVEIAPVREQSRLASLDVLRGMAIFGIFMVNVQYMAWPFEWISDPHRGPVSEAWAWALTRTFFESNFVAIFSMLFGAGLVLQMTRAEEKQSAFAPVYLRRLALLMMMGLAHGIFLFLGDILLLYSIVGLVLFLARRTSPRTMLLIAVIPLLIALAGAFLVNALDGADSTSGTEAVATEDEFLGDLSSESQIAAYNEGPLSRLIGMRATTFAIWMIISSLWFNWRVTAMFFVGAALMKHGFFEPRRKSWHVRFAVLGLAVGGGLEALTTWKAWGDETAIEAGLFGSLHEISSLVLAFGYMGATCLIVHSGILAPLAGAIASVGRMALSNYILQSVVANVLFTFIGLAWFGERTRWELIAIVCVTYAIQIVLSILWLRFFRMGPLEWAWRWATYLQKQPLLR